MVDVSYQMVLSTLQTVGLLVGIIYYVMTLQDTRKNQQMTLDTRQANLLTNVIDKWYNEEGLEYSLLLLDSEWSTHEEWLELIQNDREYRKAYYFLAEISNYIGTIVKENLVEIKLAAMCYGANLYFWEKHRDIVYKERDRRNNKNYCAMWEHFYNELVKYLDKHPELAP